MAILPAAATSGPAAGRIGDFTSANPRMLILIPWAIIIGLAAALIAVTLLDLIGFFTNLFYYGRISFSFASPSGNSLGLLAVGVPVIGGVIVGLMARFGSERIRGHGIPEALEAILINKSKIEPRVTVLKPVATAISIGSGGPFGAEGPIIMTAGALGSVFGQFLRITSMERKTLLVAGAAAGMAATFNSPLAAVLLSVELLLFEWKPRSLIPVGAAVTAATVLRWQLIGANPLFPIPLSAAPTTLTIISVLLLGLLAGAASAILTRAVYASEDGFRKLPIHWMWWPALGGLAIGVGGLFQALALGVGYNSIDALLLAQFGFGIVLSLLIVKAAIWTISLGSGTSGGVLAPLLIIGGSLGGLLALILPGGSIGLFVLVGMGAMIGGTMRAPFTGVVFSLELTHDLPALLPLLVAALTADAVTVLVMKRSILTEKIARRGVHVSREYSVDPLEQIPIRSVMRTHVQSVAGDLSVEQVLRISYQPDAGEIGISLIDDQGAYIGFVSRTDLRKFVDMGGDPSRAVTLIAPDIADATYPDEPTRMGAERLAQVDGMALPVFERGESSRVIGFITRETPFEARVLWTEGEDRRERLLGWPVESFWAGIRARFRR
jgi:chloride channel protein, CIC family